MKLNVYLVVLGFFVVCSTVSAGPYYLSGKITSLLASGTDPGIRLSGNGSPDNCDGGKYGWLRFQGTAEERNRIYASALAFSLSKKRVTVYTNRDGTQCRINNIQVTSNKWA